MLPYVASDPAKCQIFFNITLRPAIIIPSEGLTLVRTAGYFVLLKSK